MKTVKIPVWTTQDGTQIPLTKMTDAHLANAIKFLVKKYDDELAGAFIAASSCSGDTASYYAYQTCDDVHPSPWIDVLRAEQQRRKNT